ncbi:serine protease [Streptomyces sp. CHD11]|uniref:SSI family serine proteinase inhibitor n=1 Tax=Streptomyces sp. CHD11 TaxID=2741325 RepID=UPI001BFC1B9A|nr:SSI family serine proteinase inhibitor [Streptomyces sp. CHD11]MBT3149987.1 serine protease [Streptomyces sp. CHD11]
MTHTSPKTVRAVLLTALALLACAAPARAGAGHHPGPDSRLLLTVGRGETPAAEGGTVLWCDPPEGRHRRAADACAELAAADGRISAIPVKDAICPMVYAPVTARASGTWRGRPVAYSETFPNTCTLTARTGAVFALDPA